MRTWKLQQQREQEEKRRQEEEERRKREDEIRRIRDLSNQDEQYNRFMKLVGGRKRTRSKVRCRILTLQMSSPDSATRTHLCLRSVQGPGPPQVCRQARPGHLREPLPV